MINKALLLVVITGCGCVRLSADDYKVDVLNATQAFYQGAKTVRGSYLSYINRQTYQDVEERYGADFNALTGSAFIPNEALFKMKALAVQRNPWRMQERVQDVRGMMQGYYFLNQNNWGKGLPVKVRKKIKEVGGLLYGDDYAARYRWALDESLAYQRLQEIKFDTTAAKKKYPNSYQSQLKEALGIRPD